MGHPTFAKFDLTGRTALVTGGGTGLGYNMARALAALGAKVMIASRREQVLRESAAKLNAEQPKNPVIHYAADLLDREQTAGLAKHAIDTMGGVDIFIGNSAQDRLSYVDAIPDSTIDDVIRINLQANIELTRAFLPHMRRNKWGRVIFSSSVASVCGPAHPGFGVYAASKGGINAFTRVTASETGRDGITVNCLVLGLYITPMLMAAHEKLAAEHGPEAVEVAIGGVRTMTAAGRTGGCEEVEGLIQLLASDAGSYITGAQIPVDGGLSIAFAPNPL